MLWHSVSRTVYPANFRCAVISLQALLRASLEPSLEFVAEKAPLGCFLGESCRPAGSLAIGSGKGGPSSSTSTCGWEVGYVDTVNRPCVDREHYCKIGAGGSIPSLSFRGCGDGTERFVFSKRKLLEQLNGLWVMQSPNGGKQSVKIEKKGLITFKSPSNKPIRGQFKLVDSVTMDVQTDEQHGFILHFGLVDGALHLTRRELTHAKNAKSFLIIISERQSVRRFRGACYELHTPPRDYPITIECPIKPNEVGQTISIKLNDKRTISLYRRGEYWMEADGTAGRYTRARTKKKK